MSRGTVIAGISIDLVNTTSSTLYPSIKNLLAGSYNVPEYSVTLNWQITQAPVFSLITQNHADVPAVNLQFSVSTDPGGDSAPASASAVISTQITNFNGQSGTLSLAAEELSFTCNDPLLKAVLNAKEEDIRGVINNALGVACPTLGPIKNLTFSGTAIQSLMFFNCMYFILFTGEGDTTLTTSADVSKSGQFNIGLDNQFVKDAVNALYWQDATKTYNEGPATIWLDSYDASASNGALNLTLWMSGKYEIPFLWGTARWMLEIDPVHVTAPLSFDDKNNLVIDNPTVSKPGIKAKADNAGAVTLGILYGPLVEIILQIADSIASGKIHDTIKSQLSQPLLAIPSPSKALGNLTIVLTPINLSIDSVDDYPIIARGRIDVGAYSIQSPEL